jgi:hypothetical protein
VLCLLSVHNQRKAACCLATINLFSIKNRQYREQERYRSKTTAVHFMIMVGEGACSTLSDTRCMDKRSTEMYGNIRIMILVHLNFCQSFDSPPPQPVTTHHHLLFFLVVFAAAHNVEISKRIYTVYRNGSLGAHTTRWPSDDAPIRRPSTQK